MAIWKNYPRLLECKKLTKLPQNDWTMLEMLQMSWLMGVMLLSTFVQQVAANSVWKSMARHNPNLGFSCNSSQGFGCLGASKSTRSWPRVLEVNQIKVHRKGNRIVLDLLQFSFLWLLWVVRKSWQHANETPRVVNSCFYLLAPWRKHVR